ncbi:3'-5' exonuclease [Undibacterium aquatile]|uniref:DNA 3'-5' helicase n=1 Tax=Undibacterium aquatile TaxID=1537398 RepID=A0ABR6XJ43_9BURK|nr:3'-5' exonuclease [Undibacterium aquatile]MBC3812753.1 DEAD/DEAH box helicase [Undibacterium aquatile]
MRALIDVGPTPEQLSLISRIQMGVEVIRGAAGSGKTTTALLKLRSSIGAFLNRKRRQKRTTPINILLLTYNRTLSGYVSELAHKQFTNTPEINLEVSTFSKWAKNSLGINGNIIDGPEDLISRAEFLNFCSNTNLSADFVREEVDYLMGKYLPREIAHYLTARRDGRGGTPRMAQNMREKLLNEIVYPYMQKKYANAKFDWNDLAVAMAERKFHAYDIVIVDESQDFSGNQIRAVMNQLLDDHSVTFILDTAQRIYARGFTWAELGISVRPENSFRLSANYRNTKQIARFATSLLKGIGTDDDGTLPDFSATTREGQIPIVLKGSFGNQVKYAINFIKSKIDLSSESVAFLHPLGWFKALEILLNDADLQYITITRASDWPIGSENIALSTLHSAKGLEFDHVFILGLNAEVMPHGDGNEDEKLLTLRRLLAMGIGRAKSTIILGYKPEDASTVIEYLDPETFMDIAV